MTVTQWYTPDKQRKIDENTWLTVELQRGLMVSKAQRIDANAAAKGKR